MRASFDAPKCSQKTTRLEREFETEPEEALSDEAAPSVGAINQTEIPICYTIVGIVEIRMVSEVKCFSPDLHLQLFLNGERAKEAKIKIAVSGPANRVKSRRAEARLAYWSKSGRVEIRRSQPMCSVDRNLLLDLIGYLVIARCIQGTAGSADGDRCSRVT